MNQCGRISETLRGCFELRRKQPNASKKSAVMEDIAFEGITAQGLHSLTLRLKLSILSNLNTYFWEIRRSARYTRERNLFMFYVQDAQVEWSRAL